MRRSFSSALNARYRRPVIRTGQSNAVGCYSSLTQWSPRLRCEQDGARVYHLAFANAADVTEQASWHRIGGIQPPPSQAAKGVVGNWGIDLADGLLGAGCNVALIEYCVGNTGANFWTPGAVGSQYPTVLAWLQARLAELDSPLDPLLVHYQGESGVGGAGTWAESMATYAAGLREDLACPGLGIVVVQIPPNSAIGTAVRASQAEYVASDVRSRLAFCRATTFDQSVGPANVHIDVKSARSLAVGPVVPGVTSSVLSNLLELM